MELKLVKNLTVFLGVQQVVVPFNSTTTPRSLNGLEGCKRVDIKTRFIEEQWVLITMTMYS